LGNKTTPNCNVEKRSETRQRKFIERLIHPWRVFCLSVNEMFHWFYEKKPRKEFKRG